MARNGYATTAANERSYYSTIYDTALSQDVYSIIIILDGRRPPELNGPAARLMHVLISTWNS